MDERFSSFHPFSTFHKGKLFMLIARSRTDLVFHLNIRNLCWWSRSRAAIRNFFFSFSPRLSPRLRIFFLLYCHSNHSFWSNENGALSFLLSKLRHLHLKILIGLVLMAKNKTGLFYRFTRAFNDTLMSCQFYDPWRAFGNKVAFSFHPRKKLKKGWETSAYISVVLMRSEHKIIIFCFFFPPTAPTALPFPAPFFFSPSSPTSSPQRHVGEKKNFFFFSPTIYLLSQFLKR